MKARRTDDGSCEAIAGSALVGAMLGANVGFLYFGLMAAAKRADRDDP
jgi:hypothetical protein